MQRKHISDLEPEALIPNDKIRNHYKGSKIRITLLIEYLKARTLFEIRITLEARSIMSSFNDSCWSNISRQEHLIEIRISPQARLIMSSLNDSTCNLNYMELQRNLAIGKRKAQMLLSIFSKSALQIQHTWLYIASKWNY